jgi:N6-adenosine-specific RNA methylase IME4
MGAASTARSMGRWSGVGFYFRNVSELLLFGVRGRNARTLAAGRRQVNLLATRKREHSRKPDELYPII